MKNSVLTQMMQDSLYSDTESRLSNTIRGLHTYDIREYNDWLKTAIKNNMSYRLRIPVAGSRRRAGYNVMTSHLQKISNFLMSAMTYLSQNNKKTF